MAMGKVSARMIFAAAMIAATGSAAMAQGMPYSYENQAEYYNRANQEADLYRRQEELQYQLDRQRQAMQRQLDESNQPQRYIPIPDAFMPR